MSHSKSILRSAISVFRKPQLYHTVARYFLGAMMVSFGTMKITGMQFNAIAGPTSAYQQPLEYLTGVQLTWAFLGHSLWFQVLLGLFEFIPACLLLFRRTALFGAIMLLPMTVGVCLTNFGLHLWQDTKILSVVLLVLNLIIIMFDREKALQIIHTLFHLPQKHKFIIPEIIVAVILIGYPVTKKLRADYGKSGQNVLTGDWFHGYPKEFTLISEQLNDSTLPHHLLKSYFGSWEEYSEINDRANNWDGYKIYAVNEQNHSLQISDKRNRISISRGPGYYYLSGKFHYQLLADSTLILEKKVDDSTIHTWTFKQRIMSINKRY